MTIDSIEEMERPPEDHSGGHQPNHSAGLNSTSDNTVPTSYCASAQLAVATARNTNAKHWQQRVFTWAEVCEAVRHPSDHKECGNWFFGTLRGTTRTNMTVVSRSALTIDVDRPGADFLDDLLMVANFAFVAHSTYSSTPEQPRYRLIVPTDREMTPQEYKHASRAFAAQYGDPKQFDKVSFKPPQYMFLPSTQNPDTYVSCVIDGPLVDVEKLLKVALPEEEASAYDGPSYDGPSYDELTDEQRKQADEYVGNTANYWSDLFADAVEWPDGQKDDQERGWEKLTADWAWACARMAATPWTGLDAESGKALYDEVLPQEMATNEKCQGKWYGGLLTKAASKPIEPPPWETPFDVVSDPKAQSGTISVDIENLENTYEWLRSEVGRRHLSGLFRRGKELVFTPRIGEQGYIAPKSDTESAGPAQVWAVSATGLAARITKPEYRVFKPKRNQSGKVVGESAAMFPLSAAQRGVEVLDKMPNLRELNGVTHTPVIREDGTILDTPGYDEGSGLLYLPDPGFTVPDVPDEPTPEQVRDARELLLKPVNDFPWKSPHDKANFLGAWFTPLLRPMVPPPYKLFLITAPQPGSGKGYLAMILRATHGGVTKAELPSEKAEVTKVVVATLDSTTAPVVVFDNVAGTLRSSVLDALLTITKLDERILGTSRMASLTNDRLWCATGNNVSIGGDIGRRLLRTVIDTGKPHPEQRDPKDFLIPDLPSWMRVHRGEVLGAMLTLVRAWVVAGRPQPAVATGDDYGVWVAALRGLLSFAGMDDFGPLGVGVFDYFNPETADDGDEELLEHKRFLLAVHRVFGDQPWTAAQVLNSLSDISEDELPSAVVEKVHRMQGSPSRTLGKWLAKRDGTWAGGFAVRAAGENRTRTSLWQVIAAQDTNETEGERAEPLTTFTQQANTNTDR